jgi:hypothetical protein
MTNFNKKNLNLITNQNIENLNNLDKKTKSFNKLNPNDQYIKTPQVLYDSGWITPGVLTGTIVDQDIYFSFNSSTTLKGQRTPFNLVYSFIQDINISEKYLPFIKPIISIEKTDETEIEGIYTWTPYEYGSDYYQIYGDSTLIYQGTDPYNRTLSEEERLNGNFSSALASKWFYGTLKYTVGSDSYSMEGGSIVSVTTLYNVVPLPGWPAFFSGESFFTSAIDEISAGSVTGEGTYTVTVATIDEYGAPHTEITETKNVQMSAPLFDHYTDIRLSGFLFKNDIYQYYRSIDNPLGVVFGIHEYPPSGYANLVSFSFDWNEYKEWKLFYDHKRAKNFVFYLEDIVDLPTTADYQSETLPYSFFYVHKNPSNYPEIELDRGVTYKYSSTEMVWTKIDDNKYTLRMIGTIVLSSPAVQTESTTVSFIDDKYSPNEEGVYSKTSEDHEDKNMPLYFPLYSDIKIKLNLIFNHPLSYSTNKIYKNE